MNSNNRERHMVRVIGAVLLAVSTLIPISVKAEPLAQVHGATIGEWSGRWWKWILEIPASQNPLLDPTGALCGQDQKGPVWFLAGSWLGPGTTRDCTIPKDKSVFFPVVNYVWVQTSGDTDPQPYGEAWYRQCVFSGIPNYLQYCGEGLKTITDGGYLEVTLDGMPVVFDDRTSIVRTQSPLFKVKWPAGNVFGVDPKQQTCKKCGESISDGYWVMLPPLKPGKHELNFLARDSGNGVWQKVTYFLIVH